MTPPPTPSTSPTPPPHAPPHPPPYPPVHDPPQYRVILTDAASLEIRYIARVTSPTLWDALFADALVHELARRVAYAITRNATLVESLRGAAELKWRQARSVYGLESRPLRQLLSTSFTDVR